MNVFNINLIAARRRQKRRSARMTRLGVYSLIALAMGVVMLYYVMDTKVQQVQAQIDTTNTELSAPDLARKKDRIAFLEQQTATLQPRVQLLEKVHSSESDWIRIISDIGSCTPADRMWLTQMTSQRSEKAQTISFRGLAFQQSDIGRFMLSISEHQDWSGEPSLSFTQTRVDGASGGQVIEFEVAVPLQSVIGSDLK